MPFKCVAGRPPFKGRGAGGIISLLPSPTPITFDPMMKILVLFLLLASLSCGNKTNPDKKNASAHEDKSMGSTLENINTSEYSVVHFKEEDELCFATVNHFFKDYGSKVKFPFSLWVTVETAGKNVKGHPDDAEAALFNNVEDALINKFITTMPFCYIGRTTRNGYREIMFYVSDKDKATSLMNDFIRDNTFGRKINFEITSDPMWQTVEGLFQ
jgi:hypothetical protein